MAQSKFKTGDRVHWKNSGNFKEDWGTVQPDSHSYGLSQDCVWVKWDSDGEILHISEEDIEYEQPSSQGIELTVQNCIYFLISQVYSVTVSK